MGQFVRRFWSCETGSALTEYGLIIAVLAVGLVAALEVFRNKVGGVTEQTAITISHQAGRGYGSPGAVPPLPWQPSPERPSAPDSAASDSAGAGAGGPTTAHKRP